MALHAFMNIYVFILTLLYGPSPDNVTQQRLNGTSAEEDEVKEIMRGVYSDEDDEDEDSAVDEQWKKIKLQNVAASSYGEERVVSD